MKVEQFESVKKMVLTVLEESLEARDNDMILYIKCCQKIGAKTIDDILTSQINPESIRRTRQIIQNVEKKFIPSPEVIIARKQRSVIIAKYIHSLKEQD